MKQHTISIPITAQGLDLNSQQNIQFVLRPSTENSGIVFRRVDLTNAPDFCLKIDSLKVLLPDLQSTYFNFASFLPLLAVLRALQIDNVLIECECDSMPYMGDSASVLLFLVQSAGLSEQNALRKSIVLNQPVTAKLEQSRWSRLIPSEKKRMATMNSQVHAEEKVVAKNTMVDFTTAFFVSELCHARTEKKIDHAARALESNKDSDLQYSLLTKEKSQRNLFDVYSILSLLPYPINADYIGFNAQQNDNLYLLKNLLDQDCIEIVTNLSLSSEYEDDNQSIMAI